MAIQTHVRFLVEYEDGSTAAITIDGSALDQGDRVALAIAKERQSCGEIPEGHIKTIRRDPPG
jgi:hypothetical protein